MRKQFGRKGSRAGLRLRHARDADGPAVIALIRRTLREYLDGRWRGRGLGRRLLRVALAFARRAGFRRVVLETNVRLCEAVALYVRNGFRLLERRCIPPRCDAVYVRALR